MAKAAKPALPAVRIENGRFTVASESVPGKTYDVTLGPGPYSCTCEAGQHSRQCKHIKAALAQHESEEQQLGLGLNGGNGEKLGAKPKEKAPRFSRLDKLGYEFGEVASAMQKEIRRGDERAAVYWGLLLYDASPYYVWKRVMITAAEDIGLAAPATVALVCDLAKAWSLCKQGSYWVSPHALSMAIMALCRADKSTEVEDLQSLTLELQKREHKLEMPEYAKDAHTKAGKEAGKTWAQWYDDRFAFGIEVNPYLAELAQLMPEWFSPEMKERLDAVKRRRPEA